MLRRYHRKIWSEHYDNRRRLRCAPLYRDIRTRTESLPSRSSMRDYVGMGHFNDPAHQRAERQEARPADPRLLPGHCHKCGCPRVDNPHPDAGKPGRYLEVGCEKECLPCTVLSRHQWYQRAVKAEKELRELKDRMNAWRTHDHLANVPAANSENRIIGFVVPVSTKWPLACIQEQLAEIIEPKEEE
jgi:hypothetical protein